MSAVKQILKFIVNSNIFIALCALAATFQTYLLLDVPVRLDALSVLVFFSALIVYNLHRMLSIASQESDVSEIHRWMRKYSMLLFGMLGIASSVVIICFLLLESKVRIALAVLGIISFFYAVPLPLSKAVRFRIRDLGVLKPFIVGFVWAVATVALPVLNYGNELSFAEKTSLFLQCFFFISAITIPFDIRDMEYDRKFLKTGTIAILFGLNKTKAIASITLIGFLAAVFFREYFLKNEMTAIVPFIISFLISLLLILRTNPSRSEYYYTFWIDSAIVMQFLFVFLLNLRKIKLLL